MVVWMTDSKEDLRDLHDALEESASQEVCD